MLERRDAGARTAVNERWLLGRLGDWQLARQAVAVQLAEVVRGAGE